MTSLSALLPDRVVHRVGLPVLLSALLLAGGCSAQDRGAPAGGEPAGDPAVTMAPVAEESSHTGDGEDAGALTPAGPLQGNWRVTRPNDPSDAAILLVHAIQDQGRFEGSYVIYQPFCGIDLPPVRAGSEVCEFDGMSGEIGGEVINYEATITFAPGADGQDHRMVFETEPASGPLTGQYFAPGEAQGVPIILSRAPE